MQDSRTTGGPGRAISPAKFKLKGDWDLDPPAWLAQRVEAAESEEKAVDATVPSFSSSSPEEALPQEWEAAELGEATGGSLAAAPAFSSTAPLPAAARDEAALPEWIDSTAAATEDFASSQPPVATEEHRDALAEEIPEPESPAASPLDEPELLAAIPEDAETYSVAPIVCEATVVEEFEVPPHKRPLLAAATSAPPAVPTGGVRSASAAQPVASLQVPPAVPEDQAMVAPAASPGNKAATVAPGGPQLQQPAAIAAQQSSAATPPAAVPPTRVNVVPAPASLTTVAGRQDGGFLQLPRRENSQISPPKRETSRTSDASSDVVGQELDSQISSLQLELKAMQKQGKSAVDRADALEKALVNAEACRQATLRELDLEVSLIRQKLATIEASKAELDRGRSLAEDSLKTARAQLADERAWAMQSAAAQAEALAQTADAEAKLNTGAGLQNERLRDEIEALAERLEEAALADPHQLENVVRRAQQRLTFSLESEEKMLSPRVFDPNVQQAASASVGDRIVMSLMSWLSPNANKGSISARLASPLYEGPTGARAAHRVPYKGPDTQHNMPVPGGDATPPTAPGSPMATGLSAPPATVESPKQVRAGIPAAMTRHLVPQPGSTAGDQAPPPATGQLPLPGDAYGQFPGNGNVLGHGAAASPQASAATPHASPGMTGAYGGAFASTGTWPDDRSPPKAGGAYGGAMQGSMQTMPGGPPGAAAAGQAGMSGLQQAMSAGGGSYGLGSAAAGLRPGAAPLQLDTAGQDLASLARSDTIPAAPDALPGSPQRTPALSLNQQLQLQQQQQQQQQRQGDSDALAGLQGRAASQESTNSSLRGQGNRRRAVFAGSAGVVSTVAAGCKDGKVHIVDTASGTVEKTMQLNGAILSVSWSPCRSLLAAGTASGQLVVFDGEMFMPGLDIEFARKVKFVSFKPAAVAAGGLASAVADMTGTKLLLVASDNKVSMLDVATGRSKADCTLASEVRSAGWSPSGSLVAAAFGEHGSVRIMTASNLREKASMQVGHLIVVLTFGASERHVIVASVDKRVRLLDSQSGDVLRELPCNGYILLSMHYRRDIADERKKAPPLVAGCSDGHVRLLDVAQGGIAKGPKLGQQLCAVAWSPTGGILAVGSEDGRLRLVDSSTGQQGAEVSLGSTTQCVDWCPPMKR
eukprot:TRINITY_DN7222_c0_g1_i1.p1 TRINITY_DN7222_c0_g1~~TRINITY_DN7222_c0_g1_i1.p1  ORF type:complete len:1160 (-),score=276.12 TRINITY_DN7222_c0_g1_i1:635-4114(-)